MNAIVKREDTGSTELEIFSGASVFDTERYEQVDRVASVMAAATLIPQHLKGRDFAETKGNCFLICNLAANWKLDPFAVAQATALVFGKITLEGKLVRAVIKKHLGFDLDWIVFGEGTPQERIYVWDHKFITGEGDDLRGLTEDEILALLDQGARITPGTFEKWHTKAKDGGVNDNWLKDRRKMLRERGAREWCREFEPGLMLGVYTPDEFDDADLTSRSNRARDITSEAAITKNPLVDETQRKSEAQTGTADSKTSPGPQGSPAPASAKPAPDGAGGAGASAPSDARPQTNPSSPAPGANGGNGGDALPVPPTRVSADLWRGYHSALARMAKPESVTKAHNAFWKEGAGQGVKMGHPDDLQLGKDILRVHGERAEGKIDGDMVAKEINGWIEKVTAL